MKWYLTMSESSIDRENHGWRGLLRVALRSAKENTNLVPHLIYDGMPSAFTQELEAYGVKIIYHRVSFYDALVEREKQQPGYLPICSGTFLRVEIPIIENDEDFIFYTDCDVNFLSDPSVESLRPETFASAPQANMQDYVTDINTGIMVMNIKRLRQDLPDFISFIVGNINSGWPGCDQENYRRFYSGNWSRLPLECNWKPYWGLNNNASIVHWHGPKPNIARKLIADPAYNTNASWQSLYERDPRSYRHYVGLWDSVYKRVPSTFFGHIDYATKESIGGWILNQDNMDMIPTVQLSIAEKYNIDIVCQARRSDLEHLFQSKVGGFAVDLTQMRDLKAGDSISFSAGNNTLLLKSGNKTGLESSLA